MSYYTWLMNREIVVHVTGLPQAFQSVIEVGDTAESTAKMLILKKLKEFDQTKLHLTKTVNDNGHEVNVFQYTAG